MFVFDLNDGLNPDLPSDIGEIRNANATNFNALRGMAINRLTLHPGTLNPPHWHPNAHEVVYIISGKALFGIRGVHGNNRVDVFTAEAGDVVFIEQNYLHYFKSIDDEDLEVAVWFTSRHPTTITFAESLAGTCEPVVAQAFGVTEGLMTPFSYDPDLLIGGDVDGSEREISNMSHLKFNFDDVPPSQDDEVGKLQIMDPTIFSEMQDFTLARICLEPRAMRQIHWHRFVNELNLVVAGQAEFGIVPPDGGQAEVHTICENGLMMAPLGYSHYVRNPSSDEPLEFLLGFDAGDVAGIDVRQCLETLKPDSIKYQTLNGGDTYDFSSFDLEAKSLIPPVS